MITQLLMLDNSLHSITGQAEIANGTGGVKAVAAEIVEQCINANAELGIAAEC